MAYTPGVFTSGTLGDIIAKENEFITTSRISEGKRSIVAGQAILAHQDPNIDVLGSGDGIGQRCVAAKVSALRGCSITVSTGVDATVSCTITPVNEVGSEGLSLAKENLLKTSFKVLDKDCHNIHSFADKTAFSSLVHKYKLENELCKILVAKLATGIDTLATGDFRTTPNVTFNSGVAQVERRFFQDNLVADIAGITAAREMNDAIIVGGRSFYNDVWLANKRDTICCDNTQVLGMNPFGMYLDLANVDTSGPLFRTFVLDKNALIFWSAPDYLGFEPTQMDANTYVWRDTLPRLQYFANGAMQPIYIDVRASRICSTLQNGEAATTSNVGYGWAYEYVVRGALAFNLADCNNRKGIFQINEIANTGVDKRFECCPPVVQG